MQRFALPVSLRSRLPVHLSAARIGASALLLAGMVTAVDVPAQTATDATMPRSAAASKPPAVKSNWSRLHWRELSVEQQQALGPLASQWASLSEVQKRKWLVIAQNQSSLSPAEKAVQHSRMTEWVGLSREQREQARFNFDEVKRVPAAERKAKWEAYQALSAEEKQRLASTATKRPQGAAGTIRPVPAQKLAPVPSPQGAGRPGPRIELAPQPTAVPTLAVGEPPAAPPAPNAAPVVPLLPN